MWLLYCELVQTSSDTDRSGSSTPEHTHTQSSRSNDQTCTPFAPEAFNSQDPQRTLIFPSWAPVANISVSLLKHMHSTASSIIMKLSWAWYFRSWITNKAWCQLSSGGGLLNIAHLALVSLPFWFSPLWSSTPQWSRRRSQWRGTAHRGRIGNTPHEISVQTAQERHRRISTSWTSDVKTTQRSWTTTRTLICLLSWVGKRSSSTSFTAALPLNKSMVVPGGRRPWCCCHFRDWRTSQWTQSRNTGKPGTSHTYSCFHHLPVPAEPSDERAAPRWPPPLEPVRWLHDASLYCCRLGKPAGMFTLFTFLCGNLNSTLLMHDQTMQPSKATWQKSTEICRQSGMARFIDEMQPFAKLVNLVDVHLNNCFDLTLSTYLVSSRAKQSHVVFSVSWPHLSRVKVGPGQEVLQMDVSFWLGLFQHDHGVRLPEEGTRGT